MSRCIFHAAGALVVAFAFSQACSASSATPEPIIDASTGSPEEVEPDADHEIDASTDGALPSTCPRETPSAYPWKPPAARRPNACTDEDLAKLASAIAKKDLANEDDIAQALGGSCSSCALGKSDDPTWRAIVAGHPGYIGNVGGCVVHLGADEACGQAIDQLSTCLIVGCNGCAGERAKDACADRMTNADGPCTSALGLVRKRCPAVTISSAFDPRGACQSFVETIRLFCGPARDGG